MRIAVILKHPFDAIFGLEQTEADVPEGSTVQDVVDFIVEKHVVTQALTENKLINEGSLLAFYAIDKDRGGGTIVKNDKILKETNSLTILGTFIGG